MTKKENKLDGKKITVSSKVLNALAIPSFGISIIFSTIQIIIGNYGTVNFVLVGIFGGGIIWTILSIIYILLKYCNARVKGRDII